METALRTLLLTWLAGDPLLSGALNAITEEAPSRTAFPWLAIAATASTDWSTKTQVGREVRVALELRCRGDRPDTAGDLTSAVEQRMTALPSAQATFSVVTIQFMRARAEQRAGNTRAILFEYRFRLLAN
jgi:hypothetical protein